MEKKKNTQVLIIAVLSFAILFMSIGFAVYTETLDINGTATVKASKWSVHFDQATFTETSDIKNNSKTVTDLSVIYDVNLTKPGDTYEFNIDVVNDGTFDATLTTVKLTNSHPEYVDYVVTYGERTFTANEETVSIPLNVDNRENVKVKVTYKVQDDSNALPESDTTTTLSASLHYDSVE